MDIRTLPDAHLRIFDRPAPPPPSEIKTIYLIGICGTGMGTLAGLLKQAGYEVSGSDQNVYPPMSTRLANDGILVHQGYDPQHLQPAPDLVIVGNACTPTHPEATYARENNLVQLSFPEALAYFFLQNRRSLVVAGTHGKTTTTGMLAHMLSSASLDPGYMIGGVLQGKNTSYQIGTGPHFAVEGDEYDSAYFDKGPKFWHYGPQGCIITSMELDHTDIYPDWETYQDAFRELVSNMKPADTLALCGDHPAVAALSEHTTANVITYGLDPANEISATDIEITPEGQAFTLTRNGEAVHRLFLPMHGNHNLSNIIGACALLLIEDVMPAQYADGLSTYRGMRRRQEIRGEVNDVLVIDDFAHHPTAVEETLSAIKKAYPERRVVAVFEPRSNTSRRKDFQNRYVQSFKEADEVFISIPPFRHNDNRDNFMDTAELIADVRKQGVPAHTYASADEMLPHLLKSAQPGDAFLIMSNGGFGGIHEKLLNQLKG